MAEREATSLPATPGLLLYCIGGASLPLPDDVRGVRGGGLRRIVHGGLAAVVSPLAEPERLVPPATADLLEYERVIRSRHAEADVVPMRFGGVLADEGAVRAHLDAQRTAYQQALTRVAGCVELGVRALLSPPPPPTSTEPTTESRSRSGADYLKARQRRYSAENRLREQGAEWERSLLSKVAPLCREHRLELSPPRPGEPVLCSLYFLVPRDGVSGFREAASLAMDGGPVKSTLSGPWPPFNFVG